MAAAHTAWKCQNRTTGITSGLRTDKRWERGRIRSPEPAYSESSPIILSGAHSQVTLSASSDTAQMHGKGRLRVTVRTARASGWLSAGRLGGGGRETNSRRSLNVPTQSSANENFTSRRRRRPLVFSLFPLAQLLLDGLSS